MMPNDKAKNVVWRDITKKDRDMLSNLRKAFGTRFNNVAVKMAAYSYFDFTKKVQDLVSEKSDLIGQIAQLQMDLANLKSEVTLYLDLQDEFKANDHARKNKLKALSLPVKTKTKEVKRSSSASHKSLSALLNNREE